MASHAARGGDKRRTHGFGRNVRSLKFRAVLALGILVGLGASATGAFWTQSVSIPSATFTAGTLDLQVSDTVTGSYAFDTLKLADMLPGNSVAAMVPVQNKSQYAKLRYTVDARATGALGSSLRISVFAGGTASNNNFSGTCSGTALGGVTTLSGADQTVVASSATDARPAIAPAGSEAVCVRIELPTSASAALINTSSIATLTFRATSVQN